MVVLDTEILSAEIQKIKQFRSSLGLSNEAILSESSGPVISQVDLAHIAENLEVTAAYSFSSHRKILGSLIVGIKDFLVNRIMNPILRLGLGRQWALNQHLYHTAAVVMELDQRIRLLENRLATLEQSRD